MVERLLALVAADALPVIPGQGSVGASGDLAPLAHMSAALLGEGEIVLDGERLPAGEALTWLGLEPLALGPKEGLALINGTQVSTAIALDVLFTAERVFGSALIAGALSTDALKGTDAPFDPRIHAARGQPGQIDVAAVLRGLLDGQRDPPQPRRLRPGAGSLQLPLPAAGDGRGARPDPQCRADARDRGQCGQRQSAAVRRRGACRAAISTPQPVAFAADILDRPSGRCWEMIKSRDCTNDLDLCISK